MTTSASSSSLATSLSNLVSAQRILTVSCAALEAQTSTSLQAISLEGREDINSLFSYQLILQSP
ncbi:hypothetical protein KIK84_16210, partial [Curvibacter sp. CHRR-16]|uniref:hypothetical protein n=1 Tax=Curvibacter sp. CHRR-16 TaxID=2835872 RepID=UPI001BDA65E5